MVFSVADIKTYALNHLEKLIFLSCLFLFGAYIVSAGAYTFSDVQFNEVEKVVNKINVIGQKAWKLSEMQWQEVDYVARFRTEKQFAFYDKLLTRDVFHPYVVAVQIDHVVINPYVLMEVIRKEIPLVWKGKIKNSKTGETLLQINDANKTYFVKQGDEIDDYKIMDFNDVYVVIQKKGLDKTFKLEQNSIALEEDVSAKIYNKQSGQTLQIVKGSLVEGWKVLSIEDEYVRMQKDQLLIFVKPEKGDK